MAAVAPRVGLSNTAELQRARYTPTSPGFASVCTPQHAQQLLTELNQEPGRKTAHNEIAKLWSQYSELHQPASRSRFSPQPATAADLPPSLKTLKLPSHKALAARLADAAARQQRQQQQRRNANVWTTHLAADVAAVCKELELPAATARVLAAAALKGHVSANPGVMLSQLVRLLPLEQHLWGPGSLSYILQDLPALVHYDPKTLTSNLAAVQQTLGSHSKAVSLIKRHPQLLTCSPFRLQSNLSKLQDMLGFSSGSAAAAACARQPLLLLSSPDSLQQRWQQLQQLMPAVGADLLRKQIRRSPELLLLKTSTVVGKMRCLQQLFDGYEPTAAAAAAAAAGGGPNRARTATPKQQHGRVVAADNLQHAATQDSRATAAAAAATAAASAAVVAVPSSQFVAAGYSEELIPWDLTEQLQEPLVLQPPLQLPPLNGDLQQKVAAKLAQLKAATAQLQQRQQQLQQQPNYKQHQLQGAHRWQLLQRQSTARHSSSSSCDARVQHLVLKVPALLALNPETLQNHVIELQLLLGLQPEDGRLQRIVLLQPGLLTQSPATLANKLQLLQYLTSRTEAAVQEMVLKCPAVLTLSIANVTNKWEVLQRCVGACGVWQQQLKDAANVTVALTLCYSVQRLLRLEYVVQICLADPSSCTSRSSSSSVSSSSKGSRASSSPAINRQTQQQALAAVPWRSLIQDSEQAFCRRYPGYKAWLQQQLKEPRPSIA